MSAVRVRPPEPLAKREPVPRSRRSASAFGPIRRQEGPMFDPETIENAVDLQQRSYRLLRWMTDAIDRGFVQFDVAHHYATLPEATRVWLKRHHHDLPRTARPELEQ